MKYDLSLQQQVQNRNIANQNIYSKFLIIYLLYLFAGYEGPRVQPHR